MKKQTFFIAIFLCFIYFSASAQKTITGKIVDEKNLPLPGATILVKNTNQGVTANADGNYSISANSGDTLIFSMIGMTTQKIAVGMNTVINMQLKPEFQQLDEIVVIGYGTVKKRDLSGSVSAVKGDDMQTVTSSDPVQALAGKVPGVQVTTASGQPGQSPEVRIRGVGTFNNSSPIYVVDGMILNDISFLSSNDIQSVEVLKDASATAIYGNRGANGVIMITTKRGKDKEGKPVLSYSGEFGMQQVAKKIDLMNAEEFANAVNFMTPGSYQNIKKLPNTDWQDLIFRSASIQTHDLSISGATKLNQYYYGLSYFDQEGIIPTSSYKRVSLKLNNVYNLFNKTITFGNNVTISPYRQQNAPGGITFQIYRAWPLLKPYLASPGYYTISGVPGVTSLPNGGFASVPGVGNPLADIAFSNDVANGLRAVGNLYVEAKLFKMFTLKSSFGIDGTYSKDEQFDNAFSVDNAQIVYFNKLTKDNTDNLTWLWENTINFNKTFGKHSFDVVAGYTAQDATSSEMKLVGQNLIRDGQSFWYINQSNIVNSSLGIDNTGNIVDGIDPNLYYAMVSYLGRVNYVFDNKYILTATFRRDGSSKFSSANRWGDFPSVAAAWNVGNEEFIKNIPIISNLKVRGSWGIIGNDKIPYTDEYSATINTVSVFGTNNTVNPGTTYDVSGNPDLKWETTKQVDIGIEAGILRNQLTAEFDYYHKTTDDILLNLLVPGYLGNGSGVKITYNAASVLNRGYEFSLNWRDKRGELSYNITALGSFLHNEVLQIGGSKGIDSTLMGGSVNSDQVTQSRIGLPIGAFYGYKTDGIFQNQTELNAYPHMSQAGVGDLRFVDVNHDGVIDSRDRTYLGSPIPTFTFAFNFSLAWRQFDLACDIYGQTGNKIYNAKEEIRPDLYNYEQHVSGFWHGEGTSNTEPTLHSSGNYNIQPSDYYVLDGSFVKLRDITLGYTLPVQNSFINKCRVYVKGEGLFTLTKYTGYTPEISGYNPNGSNPQGGDVLSNGIDYGAYPVSKIYSIGLNLSF